MGDHFRPRILTRVPFLRLHQPGFKMRLNKSRIITWDQRSVTDLRARVTRLRVGDDLARITKSSQKPA